MVLTIGSKDIVLEDTVPKVHCDAGAVESFLLAPRQRDIQSHVGSRGPERRLLACRLAGDTQRLQMMDRGPVQASAISRRPAIDRWWSFAADQVSRWRSQTTRAWPLAREVTWRGYAGILLWPARQIPENQPRKLNSFRKLMVLPDRIELSTSPLPMECSTTELRQHARYRGNRPKRPPQAGGSCHKDPSGASTRRGREWPKMGKNRRRPPMAGSIRFPVAASAPRGREPESLARIAIGRRRCVYRGRRNALWSGDSDAGRRPPPTPFRSTAYSTGLHDRTIKPSARERPARM